MKTLPLLLLFGAMIPAFAQVPADPQKILYETGIKDEALGRLDRARLTLMTLACTYTDGPLADKARIEIGAIVIFQEAKEKEKAGSTFEAFNIYRSLIRGYPDSPMSKLAVDAAKALGIPFDPRQ